MTPEMMDAIRAQFGIDKPLIMQYGLYLKKLAHGDLGLRFRTSSRCSATC